MIVSATIAIYAVPAPQPVTYADVVCQPDAVSVDCNNVQSLPLRVRVVNRVGGTLEGLDAYVRVRILAGEAELGVAEAGGRVREWEYYLPADKWGNADTLAVEVHGNASYTDLLAEKRVGILRQNAVPFPVEGEWKPLPFKYKNGEYFIDPEHNLVFQWGDPVPGNSEVHPFEDMKQRPQETSWRKYSDWALLATQVFLANWAKLGSAVFSGDYMMSQYGQNAAGEADSDYRKFDAGKLGQPDCPFTPNILVNWLEGELRAIKATITGTIHATEGTINNCDIGSGTIGGFSVHDSWIESKNYRVDGLTDTEFFLNSSGDPLIGFKSDKRNALIGLNVNPGSIAVKCLGRFEDLTPGKWGTHTKTGLYIDIAGAAEYDKSGLGNTAIQINRGHVVGLRRRCRRVGSDTRLDKNDSLVMCIHGGGQITVTLPANPEDGQEIWMTSIHENKVLVNTADGSDISPGGRDFRYNRWYIWIYDGYSNRWVFGYTNN